MFDKTQKFVKDTQYLYTIIQSKEFYDRNGCFYKQTMTRYNSYCNVNEDELVKEVNSSPLQICFDDYKKLLNCVNIPNMDIASMSWFIQKKLSSDRELIEDAIGIYETLIETCGNLRNSVADFMELYGLVDNFPKIGFLCPVFIDEAMSKESNENGDDNSTRKPLPIPPNVKMLFGSDEKCEEYFGWKGYSKDAGDWGKRLNDYIKKRKWEKGEKKNIFGYLRDLHDDIEDNIQAFRRHIR